MVALEGGEARPGIYFEVLQLALVGLLSLAFVEEEEEKEGFSGLEHNQGPR